MAILPSDRITATIRELRQIDPKLGPVARCMAATVRSKVAGGSRSFLYRRSKALSVRVWCSVRADLPMEIPFADDRGSDDSADPLDHDPCPKPEKRDDHNQDVRIGFDVPYVGVLAPRPKTEFVSQRNRLAQMLVRLRMSIISNEQ